MQRIGTYRVIRRLGSGGMGEVFLARNEAGSGLARPCVVKTILRHQASDPSNKQRFLDEARLAIQLSHKNICGVTHVDEYEDGLFMVMDFVSGRDLRGVVQELVTRQRGMPLTLGLYVLREILDGLDYAHRAVDPATGAPLHIVHRDISPSNLMISFDGEVKIIDFGQALSAVKAERTQAGTVFGKLTYMSPEQSRGLPLDATTDLYSLAIVALELLTGKPYYTSVPRERLLETVATGYLAPQVQELEPDVREVLVTALSPHPERRIASAEQMRTRINRLLAKREALVGAAELRQYLLEIFPGEVERQREMYAEASASFPPSPAGGPGSASSLSSPAALSLPALVARQDAAPSSEPTENSGPRQDTRPLRQLEDSTEVITSAAERAKTVPHPLVHRPSLSPSKAVLGGLAVVGVVAIGLWLGKRLVTPAADAPVATVQVASAVPTTIDGGVVTPDDGGVDSAPEGARYLSVETIPDGFEDPGGTRDRTRRPRKPLDLRTTAAKLNFLESCKQRCAAAVLDKYRRFATLSVDEARGLGAELDSCVKRCGG